MTSPSDIPDLISGSEGKPIAVVVARDGEEVKLGPMAPERVDDAYRLGIVLGAEPLGADRGRRACRST